VSNSARSSNCSASGIGIGAASRLTPADSIAACAADHAVRLDRLHSIDP
jgi:hypothetical protein